MAIHDVQTPTRDADAITFAAAEAGGDGWANTGQELLIVRHTNSIGSDVTLTVATTITIVVDGQDVDNREIVIGAGETHMLGPFPASYYNDAEGLVSLAWSSAADIELAVLRP